MGSEFCSSLLGPVSHLGDRTEEVEVLSECETSPLLSLSLSFLFLHLKDLTHSVWETIINLSTCSHQVGRTVQPQREKQLPQYFRSRIFRKGRGNSAGAEPDAIPSYKAPPIDIAPPQTYQPLPVTGAPPPGAPRPLRLGSSRGAMELGQRAWGASGAGRGGADRGGRKESQAGRRQRRAGGRSGPGTAGPERQSRHVRQREAQPGLYHRAPAGRLAGGGGGRRPLRPDPRPAWK